jgi:hypothetical protein
VQTRYWLAAFSLFLVQICQDVLRNPGVDHDRSKPTGFWYILKSRCRWASGGPPRLQSCLCLYWEPSLRFLAKQVPHMQIINHGVWLAGLMPTVHAWSSANLSPLFSVDANWENLGRQETYWKRGIHAIQEHWRGVQVSTRAKIRLLKHGHGALLGNQYH